MALVSLVLGRLPPKSILLSGILALLLLWVGTRQSQSDGDDDRALGGGLDKDEAAYLAELDAKKKRLGIGCLIVAVVVLAVAILYEQLR